MKHARHTLDCDAVPGFTAVYLRTAGDECAFIEAHTAHALPTLLAALEAQRKTPEQVRWVIVTHAHLDHAAGASALLAACPNATLVAHPRAARHLMDPSRLIASATQVYGPERFEKLYGTIAPIASERVLILEDGGSFELGDATLRVHHTQGHAKHHFIIHDPALATVYTGDTFGLCYPALQRAGRFALATTSPTDFDAREARKSLDQVLALKEPSACLTHFGAVEDPEEVGRQVRAWIDRSEAWVNAAAATDEPLEPMTRRIADALRKAIDVDTRGRGLVLTPGEWSLLALDIDLNAQGLAFVAEKQRSGSAPVQSH